MYKKTVAMPVYFSIKIVTGTCKNIMVNEDFPTYPKGLLHFVKLIFLLIYTRMLAAQIGIIKSSSHV